MPQVMKPMPRNLHRRQQRVKAANDLARLKDLSTVDVNTNPIRSTLLRALGGLPVAVSTYSEDREDWKGR
jgi:hypothetical protein